MGKLMKSINFFLCLSMACCQNQRDSSSITRYDEGAIEFLRGEIALCGATDGQFGEVKFGLSCQETTKEDFNLAIALLHSFEYEEAEKAFTKVIDKDPECTMAYWGVAMCNFHALWRPPTIDDLKKGTRAIEIASSLRKTTKKEQNYVEAISSFYTGWEQLDHHTRTIRFTEAMKRIYEEYPDDKEAAIFYALALNSSADLSDKTYRNRRKAGQILERLFPNQPNHPGVAHYIIHSYDYPELAAMALPAARSYASIAPASAHAQHMPSHIFTRLGLWDESIISNLNSTSAAQCYAEQLDMSGNWDEEIHATDYLVYAYLQQGNVLEAKKLVDYLTSLEKIHPIGVKAAYPTAAIPARFYLETRNWEKASQLEMSLNDFPLEIYPWSNGIIHFTRALGAAHTGDLAAANQDLEKLMKCHELLVRENNEYMATQVQIMVKAAQAWVRFFEGNLREALTLMNTSAQLELQTEKQSLTPGEVLPSQELLGDLLIKLEKPQQALGAYELNLKLRPNRFNGLYGAAKAARLSGDNVKATSYYQILIKVARPTDKERSELLEARDYLARNS